MKEFKSVQDLIVKAALYDKISTTISAEELFDGLDVLKITFSKGNRQSATCIDLSRRYEDPEAANLFACKLALYGLLRAPYEEIDCPKESSNDG